MAENGPPRAGAERIAAAVVVESAAAAGGGDVLFSNLMIILPAPAKWSSWQISAHHNSAHRRDDAGKPAVGARQASEEAHERHAAEFEFGRNEMRKKIIAKNLEKALLEEGAFAKALFEYELEEHIEEYVQSKHADGDKYFSAITENANDVAMLLIDENDNVRINQEARTLLKKLWRDAYKKNLQRLIPDMARELDSGFLYVAGVKEK